MQVCLQAAPQVGRTGKAEAVLPGLVLVGGRWGYCMGSGCLESLPLCSYDRESPEPLSAAFDQLFLPAGHSTEPLMVSDATSLLVAVSTGLYVNQCWNFFALPFNISKMDGTRDKYGSVCLLPFSAFVVGSLFVHNSSWLSPGPWEICVSILGCYCVARFLLLMHWHKRH